MQGLTSAVSYHPSRAQHFTKVWQAGRQPCLHSANASSHLGRPSLTHRMYYVEPEICQCVCRCRQADCDVGLVAERNANVHAPGLLAHLPSSLFRLETPLLRFAHVLCFASSVLCKVRSMYTAQGSCPVGGEVRKQIHGDGRCGDHRGSFMSGRTRVSWPAIPLTIAVVVIDDKVLGSYSCIWRHS